jgi:hypothetical protein
MASSIPDEKQTQTSDVEFPKKSSLNSPTTLENAGGDLDEAYVFLTQHNHGDGSVDLKALRRKIDWRILPIMFLCYTMQFLDKVMINVSLTSHSPQYYHLTCLRIVCSCHGH